MCSVCARSRGGWSQVISGVVTLGRLSPRPRLCAPVGACRRVRACACVRARSFRRGVGVVWWWCDRLAVWCGGVVCWLIPFFVLFSSGGGGGVAFCVRWCGVVWL